jgi:hypothetical protein
MKGYYVRIEVSVFVHANDAEEAEDIACGECLNEIVRVVSVEPEDGGTDDEPAGQEES